MPRPEDGPETSLVVRVRMVLRNGSLHDGSFRAGRSLSGARGVSGRRRGRSPRPIPGTGETIPAGAGAGEVPRGPRGLRRGERSLVDRPPPGRAAGRRHPAVVRRARSAKAEPAPNVSGVRVEPGQSG